MGDEFYPLNPEHLVRLHKREVIDNLLNELESMREEYLEAALAASDLREAQEVLDYIRKKY
jgi:hypothetical protein